MNKSSWKILAIVSIISLIVLILFVGYAWNLGAEIQMKEIKCYSDVCQEHQAYTYDTTSSQCICYEDKEPVKTVIIQDFKK